MLAINKQTSTSQACSPHILPCKVHHSGNVNASQRHWDPQTGADGKEVAYFRGRKLQGRTMTLPHGYQGFVLEKSEQILPHQKQKDMSSEEDDEDEEDEEDDEAPTEVKLLNQVATFDRFTVWAHESLPVDAEDSHIKSMQEWIVLSQAVS
ncbi:putative ribonuclease H2 subunit C [Delphinella strobiligena]|nr:putative ribonuclease H2 subunit C [Delphinella strobiligena]